MVQRPAANACAALLGLALLAASPAAAAQPAEPAPPPAEPAPAPAPKSEGATEVVVTGTRTPESSQRSTVKTDVVTRAEAARRGATNVGEALEGQPGVQVNPSAYGILGNPAAIQMQGLDLNRVLVLEDGERVIGDIGGAIDLASMPLSDVSKIELVTGPTSSLYGADAIGGVVNVISAPPAWQGASVRGLVEGRHPWGALLSAGGAYRRDNDWIALDGSYQKSDSLRLDESVPDLTLPETSRRLIGIRVGKSLGRSIDLRLRARWIHDELDGLEQQIVPGLGPFLIDLPERTDRYIVNAGETVALGGGSNLRISLGRQWAHNESDRDRQNSPADETRTRDGTLSSLETTATVVEGRRTWVAGFRVEAEDYEQRASVIAPAANGQLERTDLAEVQPTRLGSAALYAQLGWKITDALTVMPGVRGEAHLKFGEVVVPRLAAAYRPTPEWGIRASVGRGFRAPSAKEYGFVFDHSYLGYRVIGNPDLEPERSWGVNGDVSFTPKDILLRAGVFVNWIDQLIDIGLSPTLAPGGVQEYHYENVASARTAGWTFDAAYKVIPELRTEVGYAYLWTRDDTNERPLQGRPPHTVTAGFRAAFPWHLELYMRYRGVTDAFLDDNLRAPGFSTLDARLARDFVVGARDPSPGAKIQGYVGVKDILGVQKDPHRLGDQRPIAGRIVYLGLSGEFPGET